ncbi:MAG: helix-turn-helix transcriptional regulator [Acidobacteriota bacterium]
MNGQVIRALRRQRDLRQVDVAQAAEVDPGLISRIEHNLVRDTPAVAAAKTRILKALGMCPPEVEK